MPKEVSDIKQFIEICRRKDASCTFFTSTCAGRGISTTVTTTTKNKTCMAMD